MRHALYVCEGETLRVKIIDHESTEASDTKKNFELGHVMTTEQFP